MSQERTIFKQGSTTFFISSLFFPPEIKKDVFDLYSFVRIADDYVDQVPSDKDSFYRLRRRWAEAAASSRFSTTKQVTDTLDESVVKNMLRVARKHKFEMSWIESFLDAMQTDLTHTPCQTLDETLRYIYGSGEVVGLMMARIMELQPGATEAAKLQGKALQYMNFIRDIQEDIDLGRNYFPVTDLKRFSLMDLTHETATKQPDDFTAFMHAQLDRYEMWQREAYAGYKYIPKRLRLPLQTAADMYAWTAQEIRKNPFIIYEKKVKPTRSRLLGRLLVNYLN